MAGYNYTELVQECRSPQILRIETSFRIFSLGFGIFNCVLLAASLLWWMRNRKQSRLALRTESSLILITTFVIFGTASYSLHTYSLDAPSFLNSCKFRWFAGLMSLMSLTGFIGIRSFNYYIRSKVFKEIMNADIDGDAVTTRPRSRVTDSFKVRKLLLYSTERYAFGMVMFYLLLGACLALLAITQSCPGLHNEKRCKQGDRGAIGAVLIFMGVIVLVMLLTFILCQIKTRNFPDPFKIKFETSVIIFFAVVFLSCYVLFNNVFREELKNEEHIFKVSPAVVGDLVTFGILLYAIPWQIYKSIDAEKTHLFRQNLRDVLEDPKATDLFRTHLKLEMSEENLSFYLAALKWKKDYDSIPQDIRNNMAKNIVKQWIEDGADQGISISYTVRHLLQQTMTNNDKFPQNIFDQILKEIYELLNGDPFPRFQQSPLYRMYCGVLLNSEEVLRTSEII